MVPMAKFHGAVGLAQPTKVVLHPCISVLIKGRAENPRNRAIVMAGKKIEPATTVSNKAI